MIEKNLGGENIFPLSIGISMDIDEDNCINMVKADIVLSRGDISKVSAVKEIIRGLGIECNVSVSG